MVRTGRYCFCMWSRERAPISDSLGKFNLSIGDVCNFVGSGDHELKELLDKHQSVFSEELGKFNGPKVKLNVAPKATPKFCKARPVPYSLKALVEEELNNLEKQGIITPVQHARWAAPIVPVMKKNGRVRICGDFKVTINQALDMDSYPIPRIEELFAALSGGKYFSQLDLSQAYLQLELDEASKELVTINTHKGLFQFNRLPFGVSAAPGIFQRTMETLLKGCPGVSIYIDDILVTGATYKEHLENLNRVLERLVQANLKLNLIKCAFMLLSVKYLGHIIDQFGLHPTGEKVKAVQELPAPRNLSELRALLGITNYYGKFLPNLSTRLEPLYRLLKKHTTWRWGESQRKAFQDAKEALQDNTLLVHYDSSRELVLACDASPHGLGAVLSHTMDDGTERPVAYASRTLSDAEKRYSQLEKEGLAVVFAVKKFHNYLYGRKFYIESDHQPLSYLFDSTKQISPMASARIQRWALTLSAYRYQIRYKAGKSIGNADALSRLPLQTTRKMDDTPADLIHLVDHLDGTTIKASNIKAWTTKDPILSRVPWMVGRLQIWTRSSQLTALGARNSQFWMDVSCGAHVWWCHLQVENLC